MIRICAFLFVLAVCGCADPGTDTTKLAPPGDRPKAATRPEYVFLSSDPGGPFFVEWAAADGAILQTTAWHKERPSLAGEPRVAASSDLRLVVGRIGGDLRSVAFGEPKSRLLLSREALSVIEEKHQCGEDAIGAAMGPSAKSVWLFYRLNPNGWGIVALELALPSGEVESSKVFSLQELLELNFERHWTHAERALNGQDGRILLVVASRRSVDVENNSEPCTLEFNPRTKSLKFLWYGDTAAGSRIRDPVVCNGGQAGFAGQANQPFRLYHAGAKWQVPDGSLAVAQDDAVHVLVGDRRLLSYDGSGKRVGETQLRSQHGGPIGSLLFAAQRPSTTGGKT
ncbi:MAG: hypothetical protein JST30_11980 [Armatimonadetes bacterium]|nr:hypothetical protein [Armatimonadota bacterium]